MLPKRAELEKILKTNRSKKEKEAEEKRLSDLESAKKRKRTMDEKLEKDIQDRITRIEEDILCAIKDGKNSTYRYFGDGHTAEPVWENAVARMKRKDKDYKFTIESTSVWCNNHAEAANVDYVTAREWSEPYWKLTIEW